MRQLPITPITCVTAFVAAPALSADVFSSSRK